MDLPIICTLSPEQVAERRKTILAEMRKAAISVFPIESGFGFAFKASTESLIQLAHLVDLERQCCQFLTFKIIVESAQEQIRLEVTGPPGAEQVIADFFGGA